MPLNIPRPQSGVDPNRGYAQSPSGPQGASMQPPGLAELLSQLLGQQQLRTTQTTDPGAGYAMSPSGPTAQMPPTPLRPQGVNPAGQRVVSQFDPQINPLDHTVLPNLDSPSFRAQMPPRQPQPQRQNVREQLSANYGSSPSNPNWGQDRGGSVGRMGPTTVPASTNYSALSPSNRIAGNIAAVMQGRTGPSPGVTPYLNQSGRLESPPNARPWTGFGPTGQPLPRRNPVRKPMSPYYQPGE